MWVPSKLEDQVELMEHYPSVGMLYGNTTYWHSWRGSGKKKLRDAVPRLGVPPGLVEDRLALLARYIGGDAAVPCLCSVIMRREVVQRIRLVDGSTPSGESTKTRSFMFVRIWTVQCTCRSSAGTSIVSGADPVVPRPCVPEKCGKEDVLF